MSRASLITVIVIVSVLLVASWFTYQISSLNPERVLQESQANAALSNDQSGSGYTSLEGESLLLEQFLGEPIVVLSWASWCPQCAVQLSILGDVQAQVSEDVVFLAINRAEDKLTAERYLNQNNVPDKINLILDAGDSFYSSIGGYAMPETIVYNQRGEMVGHFRGDVNDKALITLLQSLE